MPSTVKSFAKSTSRSELGILGRLIRPGRNDLSTAAARSILKIQFEQDDLDRMHALSQKARHGTLTSEERVEIDEYERVGYLLAMLHSKARMALKKNTNGR